MDFFFDGPVGPLEATLWLPAQGAPLAAAICCHPHPKHGGTMSNSVCFRTARGLQRAGLAVLRFNFRGVRGSAGEFDGKGGEGEDARAALGELERRFPGLPLWGSGFSFGSRTVAALALGEPRLARLVLVALPVLAYDLSDLERLSGPGLIVMAENDTFGTLAALRSRHPSLSARFETLEIPGVEHYFSGKTRELQVEVERYARRHLQS